MKVILKLALFIFLIWKTPKFCHKCTDGFSILNITSHLSYSPEWDIKKEAKAPLETIFNQSFYYLGSGGQSYVFVSEDGQYVLKFFKHYRMRIHPLVDLFPLPKKLDQKREKQRLKRGKKRLRDFTSYKLAFEELPEETKLIYVHLNKGSNLRLKASIIDKLNIQHTIDLDQTEFILQRKGELAYPYIQKLVKENKIEEAKEAISSVCRLLIERCEKGIYDEDAKIHRNVGFIDGKAFLIDVGRFKIDLTRKNKNIQKTDLKKITRSMSDFLETLSPELCEHLETIVE